MINKNIRRGQVWFYRPTVTPSGHIQKGPRPVIIVSNDHLNQNSSVVLAVPCTTQLKRNFPTHVLFVMDNQVSIALTEQVCPVNVEELVNIKYTLEEYIMTQVDEALKISMGMIPCPSNRRTFYEPQVHPADNLADNVQESAETTQVHRYYVNHSQASEPATQSAPTRTTWTVANMKQFISEYEATTNWTALCDKYHVSLSTLRTYYSKFKARIGIMR